MGEWCTRCCLHQSLRVVNYIMNFCGICMIIYTLWLQKMWDEGVAQFFSTSALPKPWFIYTCLGVGIAVCLSTLVGYMVANCMSKSTLCIYAISLCSLLFLQVVLIVAIFFKIDWASDIAKYIYEHHKKFGVFVAFHLKICRLIAVMAVVAQVNVVVLAVILWATETKVSEPRRDSYWPIRPNFTQSFLVVPNPSLPDCSIERCRKCEELDQMNQYESFLTYIMGVIRMRLQRRTIHPEEC